MGTTHDDHCSTARKADSVSRPLKIALLMVALVGGFYLLREHWNHVAGNWIYVLLLTCPLMHRVSRLRWPWRPSFAARYPQGVNHG